MDRVRKLRSLRHLSIALAALCSLPCTAARVDAQLSIVNTAPHRLNVNAAALRAGQYVYQTTLERDISTLAIGTRTVAVASTNYVGAPAWLLVETRTGTQTTGSTTTSTTSDSLFVDATMLRPLHWSAVQGDARLAAEFRGDTLYGGTSAPTGRRSMITYVPGGTLVSSAMLETALRLLPLQMAWEDSTTTLSVQLGGASVLPTRLSVIGEDRVRVPAGMFDCWVVAAHTDGSRGLYWVTKQDPIVVRSALDVPTLGGAQVVNALTRIGQ